MENPEDIKKGYFPIVMEMDENLGPFQGRLGGILTILSTNLRLVGGGIENFINEAKAVSAEAAAAITAAENAPPIEIIEEMEHDQVLNIPTAPPPPPSTSPGLFPPLPSLQQMRPRTPPATHSRHNE